MQKTHPQSLIVILGPTASGKSELAIKIAKRFNGEIISADSRQVYKRLNIGTGKISKKERQDIPHHLLDIVSPKQTFTVAQYQKLAKKAVKKILKRSKLPIICGGTGFYIDSLIYDYKLPAVPPHSKLRKQLEKKSTEELFYRLKKMDPRRAENIDRRNKRRLIRAIEIAKTLGKIPRIKKVPHYDFLKIGINIPKRKLKNRIFWRVDKMMKLGLINETKGLLKKYSVDLPAFDTIGYQEIIDYLQGKIFPAEAILLIKKNTWQYAKRQITWFKRDKEIHWVKQKREVYPIIKKFLISRF